MDIDLNQGIINTGVLMGFLPLVVGVIAGAIAYSLTDNILAGFSSGIGLCILAEYVVNKYKKGKARDAGRRSSRPQETKRIRWANPKPVIFEDINKTMSAPSKEVDLTGLNDALTGEPLRITPDLYQCKHCKVYYYESSINFLRRENEGKCVACTSTSVTPLRDIDLAERGRNYEPEVVTLANYQHFADQVVTFEGYVPRINRSRDGKHYGVMFEDKSWTDGLKMVVFAHCIKDAGGERFLESLLGKTVRVRGLLLQSVYGYEIVVSKRSMILGIR